MTYKKVPIPKKVVYFRVEIAKLFKELTPTREAEEKMSRNFFVTLYKT